MRCVIHIVPQLPPVVCGVGDYATSVGAMFADLSPSLRCCYLACGWRREPQLADAACRRNMTGACDGSAFWRAVDELVDDIENDRDEFALLLHYSGYGYDRGGAPLWLADALENRPRRFSQSRIVTMFHELYAKGWPWQRAFWSSARQRNVATRLARLSDGLMTNRGGYAAWLEKITGRARGNVAHLPVVSNIGEPVTVPGWNARRPRAVAFGGAANKQTFLHARAEETGGLLARLGIEEVLDIGARVELRRAPFESRGIRVEQHGFCDRDKVSELLLDSRLGLIAYAAHCIEKSSVLAAYAAHGLVSVFADRVRAGSEAARSCPGYSLTELANCSHPTDFCQRAAARAQTWYSAHGAEVHARTMLALTAPSPDSSAFSLGPRYHFTWR